MASRRRIVYQLVAPMEKTLGPAEIDRRQGYLQRHAAAGTEIKVQSVPSGYPSIESERDVVVVAPHLLSGMQRAEAEGASAGIVGCFSDPALDAIRETVKMPWSVRGSRRWRSPCNSARAIRSCRRSTVVPSARFPGSEGKA
jgi:allantoin racemase